MIPGLPGDYSSFVPVPKVTGKSSPFSSYLRPASSSGRGKRQQFQSNSQRKSSTLMQKRKPAPNKASKTTTTQRKPQKMKKTPKKNRLRTCVAPPTKKMSFRRFLARISDWKHLYLCSFLARHSVALPQLQLHF